MDSIGLKAMGDSANTPKRVSKMMEAFTAGLRPPKFKVTLFASNHSNPVAVTDIKFYSLCSHHHLPFYGTVDIEYVPNGKVIGLSKLPRIVDWIAAKPTMQESMTDEIAAYIHRVSKCKRVCVKVKAVHMCMAMRVRGCDDAITITSCILGNNTFQPLENP